MKKICSFILNIMRHSNCYCRITKLSKQWPEQLNSKLHLVNRPSLSKDNLMHLFKHNISKSRKSTNQLVGFIGCLDIPKFSPNKTKALHSKRRHYLWSILWSTVVFLLYTCISQSILSVKFIVRIYLTVNRIQEYCAFTTSFFAH